MAPYWPRCSAVPSRERPAPPSPESWCRRPPGRPDRSRNTSPTLKTRIQLSHTVFTALRRSRSSQNYLGIRSRPKLSFFLTARLGADRMNKNSFLPPLWHICYFTSVISLLLQLVIHFKSPEPKLNNFGYATRLIYKVCKGTWAVDSSFFPPPPHSLEGGGEFGGRGGVLNYNSPVKYPFSLLQRKSLVYCMNSASLS